MNEKKITTINKVSNGTKPKQYHPINQGQSATKKQTMSIASLSRSSSSNTILNSSEDSFCIESYILFWLDTNINLDGDDHYNDTIKQLRSIVKNIHVFNHDGACINFLSKIKHEKVLMVISGRVAQQIMSRIHNESHLKAVFIFCENKPKYESLEKNWPKVQGIFTDIAAVCQSLQQVVNQFEEDSIDISFLAASDISAPSLNQLDQSFMYTQLIKEILIEIEYNKQSVDDFLAYCRHKYSDDTTVLDSIQQFEKGYGIDSSISWYTADSFIYKILNRALHDQETDVIIKMGFFIRSLHENIKQLQLHQLHKFKNEFVVYRGQGMMPEIFEKLKKAKGGLISFNRFLSTSTEQSVGLDFIEKTLVRPTVTGILFTIKVNLLVSSTPFADVHEYSQFKKEKEILFSMPTVFHIDNIYIDKSKRFWHVHLTSTSDNDEQFHHLTERMREEIEGPSALYRLGALMIKLGEFAKAEEVYENLLNRTSDEHEKGHIYYQLGQINDNQNKHVEALEFYRQALKIYCENLSPDHPNIATCYNNMGLVYDNMKDYGKALSYYEKANEIYAKHFPDNHPNIANCCNSIGLVYNSMGDYEKALLFCKKAHEAFKATLPKIHPVLATSHNNMGLVYGNMKKYSDAVTSYRLAVEIGQQALPPRHPNLEVYKRNLECTKKKK
ncbi:unnamed protein product [Rotaria socialis]|uniref:NAD(P)(+)--arginine ADP-ribosyltransferase n=1 Tax=Rotaria socialis TaxID=392032 RepID=A0A820H7D2_9BILA|nr:unnamed protein product [Rotaria socialis]CAF3507713.1 unnamed protein product [Rotaria socialis]CAF4289001.1 unnamed protein product [Rotaria socialis]CAF4363283.1 unnamed protein product [Rotaria socialis]